ncbi:MULTISPECIES: conjugal transfer protein TraD [unclassified Aureimonas]|uniref:conjugal transfer protein TraD n=1 Tax=unclassified Aureimonas TaxID=2615206 RepID=UPI0006F9BBC2|nr:MULTISPECIES: conjugal transfer protein TraD [unclassified Aureimonas]KQT63300.1 conjugal transfer protein TraD [Aureimonas sp. Leaf427]KQT80120.1 conjugal transfer protein TraD [Aureimonas sp. Leaf460]
MTDERKRDAREKITLGGLVVKAGLREADRAFLLGVLMEAASIGTDTAAHRRLVAVGRKAFHADRPETAGNEEKKASGKEGV